MKTLELQPAYEAARLWTVHPVSHPPPGWAQMVRAGLAANTSHLRTSPRGKRIKQLNKIEKLILGIKRFRWR